MKIIQKRIYGLKGNQATQALQRARDFTYFYSAPGFGTVSQWQ